MAFKFSVFVMCIFTFVHHHCVEANSSPSVVAELRNLRVDSEGEVCVDVVLHNITDISSLVGLEVVVQTDADVPLLNSTHQALDLLQKDEAVEAVFYTITGLKQDTMYTLFLKINDTTLLFNYSLVTTGLQSLVALSDTEVGCVFLPGARADGCLLMWSSDEGNGEVRVSRHNRNIVSTQIRLDPGLYEVQGYGLLENVTLHNFPVKLQEALEVKSTEPLEEESTEPSISRNLIAIISAALSSTLVGVVLVCIALTLIKCRKKAHTKMKEETSMRSESESIQTAPNVCYEGILELGRTPARQDNVSLHLYDDVVNMVTVDYENISSFTENSNPSTSSHLEETQQSNSVFQQHISKTCHSGQHVSRLVQKYGKGLPQHQLQPACQPLKSPSTVRSEEQPQATAASSTTTGRPHPHNRSRVVTEPLHSESHQKQTHCERQEKSNVVSPSVSCQPQHSGVGSQSVSPRLVIQQTRSLERVLEQTKSLEQVLVMNHATKRQQSRSLERVLVMNPTTQGVQHSLGRKRPILSNGPTLGHSFHLTPLERACTSRYPIPSTATAKEHCRSSKFIGRSRSVKPVFQSKMERVSVLLGPADYETPIKTTDV